MTMYRQIVALGEQAQLLEFIKNLDYTSDPVQLVPPAPAVAIVESLGWPADPGLHILACRLDPNQYSAIHEDRNMDGSMLLRWSINIPIQDCWGTWMEWFNPVSLDPDNFYYIGNPVDGTGVPALKYSQAQVFSRSKGCDTAYIARNDHWHRIRNIADRTSWCVSVRYYPLSSESWDIISAKTPWLSAIARQGKP